MQIVSLETENIKKIKAIQIKPDGSMVIIGGKNGAGKSSVLDSIMYALGGAGTIPGKPIRNGEKKAHVTVDLGEFTVNRGITEKGVTLTIKNKEGAIFPSPQAMLDKIVGKISFDPLAFSKMGMKEQAEVLMSFSDFDFTENARLHKMSYDARTATNRDVDMCKKQLAGMTHHEDAPLKEVDATALFAQIEIAREHNKGQEVLERDVDTSKRDIESATERLAELESKLKDIQDNIKNCHRDIKHKTEELAKYEKDLEIFTPIPVDDLIAQHQQSSVMNNKLRENTEYAKKAAALKELEEEAEGRTTMLKELKEARMKAVASAKLPVDGVGFDEGGVSINGIPFSQCSSAEQLRISVAVGIALNPKLKVLLVRDGSLLDADSLASIADMVEKAGAQCWVERVGDGKEVSVIIEDGSIKALTPPVKEVS